MYKSSRLNLSWVERAGMVLSKCVKWKPHVPWTPLLRIFGKQRQAEEVWTKVGQRKFGQKLGSKQKLARDFSKRRNVYFVFDYSADIYNSKMNILFHLKFSCILWMSLTIKLNLFFWFITLLHCKSCLFEVGHARPCFLCQWKHEIYGQIETNKGGQAGVGWGKQNARMGDAHKCLTAPLPCTSVCRPIYVKLLNSFVWWLNAWSQPWLLTSKYCFFLSTCTFKDKKKHPWHRA